MMNNGHENFDRRGWPTRKIIKVGVVVGLEIEDLETFKVLRHHLRNRMMCKWIRSNGY